MDVVERGAAVVLSVVMAACNGSTGPAERWTGGDGGSGLGPGPSLPNVGTSSSDGGAASLPPMTSPQVLERLEPASDCVQPVAAQRCAGGYCEVRSGCFIMGAPRGEPGAGRYSNTQVQVTLTHGFLIGQTELTRSDWLATGWGKPKRNLVDGEGDCLESSCAVNNVSFYDALRYANWLSEREGLRPCYELTGCTGEVGFDLVCSGVEVTSESAYACEGYRLPMEAEWEYAARAGTNTAFYGGASVATLFGECVAEPSLDAIGWYCHNSGMRPHPVAEKRPNPWGLYDMHGNLGEWVNDLRDGLGYGKGPLVDPRGTMTPGQTLLPSPGQSELRVFRGGVHTASGDSCTSANRLGVRSLMSSSGLGFRLARTMNP